MSHLDILNPRPAKPAVCIHCKNGQHEQMLVNREYCSCACHANPMEQVKYEVAA